ncbi:MAG: chemotaxis protein CheD, partial [Methanosarcinales archaeon]
KRYFAFIIIYVLCALLSIVLPPTHLISLVLSSNYKSNQIRSSDIKDLNGKILVGIADLKVGKSPDVFIALGVGSCVGIALYDPKCKCGGLAHIMLPDSKKAINNEHLNHAKYADTAIDLMLKQMLSLGANKKNIISKIAGGAHMFLFNGNNNMNIGERNVLAVKNKLKESNIKLVAEDTGKNYGRTLIFSTEDGKLIVKIAKDIKEL